MFSKSSSSLPQQTNQRYESVSNQESAETTKEQHQVEYIANRGSSFPTLADVLSNWHGGPRELQTRDFSWYAEWAWDILLTLAPVFFTSKHFQQYLLDINNTSLCFSQLFLS